MVRIAHPTELRGYQSMDKRDRIYLKELASSVIEHLAEVHPGKPFILKKKANLATTNTHGWYAVIGTLAGYNCTVEIWFDRFTRYPQRKINYCVYSKHRAQIDKVIKYAKKDLGAHLTLSQDNLRYSSKHVQLEKQLAKSRFGQPIFERYIESSNNFFYGIYEIKKVGLQRNKGKRLIEGITSFVKSIIEALPEWKEPKSNTEIYSRIENRKIVTQHLRRERSGHLATTCKRKQNYVCQICSFDFEKIYGVLGADFAEAHHIVPLGSINKAQMTTIKDLITVCSNCHRMLHKMAGQKTDIAKLKSIVRGKR